MTTTKQWVLRKKPYGPPILTGEESTFELRTTTLPTLQQNQVLLQTIYLSNDPAQRSWISPLSDSERSYLPPIEPGDPMRSLGLGRVVESESHDLPIDTLVLGRTGWSQFSVHNAQGLTPIKLSTGLRETSFLGALGLPGFTAYYALAQIVHLEKSDVLVVSAAAGAVGNMVVQIAKKVLGCAKVGLSEWLRLCSCAMSVSCLHGYEKGDWLCRHGREVPLGGENGRRLMLELQGADVLR